jgi:MoaA/NifB/PqqE/SkfB family radical SAM enzyme
MSDEPLDLARKLRQAAIAPHLDVVASGGHLPAPLVVELDPTSFCDLACDECISAPMLNTSRIATERLGELAKELVEAEVLGVILIGGGEPLLHRGSAEVIRCLGEGHVAVGVTTNGTHLHRHADILAKHAAWVRVSIDASTPQTYEQLRPSRNGQNKFAAVIENARDFASRRRVAKFGFSYLLIARHGKPGPVVHNFAEVASAARLAKDIGFDYFEVKSLYDMDHYILGHGKDLSQQLAEELSACRALETPEFRVITPRTFAAGSDFATGIRLSQPKSYRRCAMAELRTLITPSGIYACPYHRGNDAFRYGDINDNSFLSIWSSDKRRQVVNELDPSVHCRFHCIRHESNLLVENWYTESTEILDDYDVFF